MRGRTELSVAAAFGRQARDQGVPPARREEKREEKRDANLGLDFPVPNHSTLSYRAATPEVPQPKAGSEPVHLRVDSTGLKLCGPGEWLIEKHGTRVRRSWRKLHIGVDADTGRIVASELTTNDVDDGSQVWSGKICDKPALLPDDRCGSGYRRYSADHRAIINRLVERGRDGASLIEAFQSGVSDARVFQEFRRRQD